MPSPSPQALNDPGLEPARIGLPAARGQSDSYIVGCFLLLVVGLYLVIGPFLRLSEWRVLEEMNPSLSEALAWKQGRTALSEKGADTALYYGEWYSVHPPLFTLISLAATTAGKLNGLPENEFYPPWYVMTVVLPLPVVGFWAFRQVLRRAEWAAVLTAYWLIGTPMLPQLMGCRDGVINAVNHLLATIGLMLIAGDLAGRRRIWPTMIGLLVAIWSRPNLVFFGLAALAVAWTAGRRRRDLLAVGAALAVSVGALLALNWLKFGNPLESGYHYIYGYRPNTWLARRALTHGLFSWHFVPEKAWDMNLAPPGFRLARGGIVPENTEAGVSIWMTSPLLLGAFLGLRHWWSNQAARALMLSSLPVIGACLAYHGHGTSAVGYFTYALDFLPVWLVVIAPWAVERWRCWFTLGCLAYSALYFHILALAYP